MIISFDSAPEDVKKLAFAIMESLGPNGIPEIAPKAALLFGKQVGLEADAYVAAVRWLSRYYAGRIDFVGRGISLVDAKMYRSVAKHFEEFAVALEAEASRPVSSS